MEFFDRFKSKKGGQADQPIVPSATQELNALDLIAQGNVMEDDGQLPQALQLYEAAIVIAPVLGRAHLNRGNVLLAVGDIDGALIAFETALEHNPGYTAAHFNMGNAHARAGRLEAALAAYSKVIALKPDFVDAEVAMGAVLDDLGRYHAAVASYRRALTIQPGYAEVHCNLGKSLRELGQFEAAIASYRRSLEINPGYAEGYNNLGSALKDLGQLDEALVCYQRALELNPAFLDAHGNLLFLLNYSNNASSLHEAQLYGAFAAKQVRRHSEWDSPREAKRRLRIGFISGDFRDHPVSYFFESVLTALASESSSRLEVFAYSNHFQNDPVTKRITALCHGWCLTAGLSDEALAQRIHDDAIDILIDLAGHTAHNRLPVFAWKPAPVQATWLGYFATTGVAAIDYLIADPWTLPASEESSFTEQIWRLPETRLCFTVPQVDVEVSPLPALINGYLTFGCFNNLTKMTAPVVALWARVLGGVPQSRLFLKSPQLNEISVRLSVVEQFAAHGIESERLVFEGLSSRAAYLACYQRVDIALDPFPYTGGTTTVEALWMGVPVLTLEGTRFLARQGVGLLMNAGLPQWIASDYDDYVSRATAHATDLQILALLRAKLRQQVLASPIFDAIRFARHFETALQGMWQKWCEKQR